MDKAPIRLLHKNHNAAETNTTKKPGSSRGNSKKDRCHPVIMYLSLRKLLNIESKILKPTPNEKEAKANSFNSRGEENNADMVLSMDRGS